MVFTKQTKFPFYRKEKGCKENLYRSLSGMNESCMPQGEPTEGYKSTWNLTCKFVYNTYIVWLQTNAPEVMKVT